MRRVLGVSRAPAGHWVGDGFPVRSLFSHESHGEHVSPFLLLDYAGPAEFPPTDRRRGVGEHPHRGFETVTIVFDGEVEHRDSTGAGGVIGPGDVQWMTAAAGILHQEFHGAAFARRGGRFEMAQLWVNLPARDKMSAPHYQTIAAGDIPVATLPDDAGTARVIAGAAFGAQGPARTFSPVEIVDLRVNAGKGVTLALPEGHTVNLAVLSGEVVVNGAARAGAADLLTLARTGGDIRIEAESDAKILALAGAPIDEPIAAHGPFVMNTREELVQAFEDFRSGRFGAIAP